MNVRKNTTGSNGYIPKKLHKIAKHTVINGETLQDSMMKIYLAELLIIAHGKLDVSWDNSGFLIVPGSIAC